MRRRWWGYMAKRARNEGDNETKHETRSTTTSKWIYEHAQLSFSLLSLSASPSQFLLFSLLHTSIQTISYWNISTMAAAKEQAKQRARTFNSAIFDFDFGHAVIALDFRGGFSVSVSPVRLLRSSLYICICICSRFRRQNEMALTLTSGAISRLMTFSGTILAC